MPLVASVTGILVVRERISSNALWWLGSRRWRKTKAIPGGSGKFASRAVKASRPPGEAPTPTTGSSLSRVARFPENAEGAAVADPALRFQCEGFVTNDAQRNWRS